MIHGLLLASAIFSSFEAVEVTRVKDGDTIEVRLDDDLPEIFKVMSVRLSGIDTPELSAKRKCERKNAERAKKELEEIIGESPVDLHFCTFEKYGRLLCSVKTRYQWASEYLISQGLAVSYAGEKKKKWQCFK